MRRVLILLALLAGLALLWPFGLRPESGGTSDEPGATQGEGSDGAASGAEHAGAPRSSRGSSAPKAAEARVVAEAAALRQQRQDEMRPFLPTPEERELWRELRPVVERQVPDPDGVGPCPPEHFGGHEAMVVRRYRDPGTGYLVWEHEDHARTILQPGMFHPDPKSGALRPTRRVVTRQVPVPESKPIEGAAGAARDR